MRYRHNGAGRSHRAPRAVPFTRAEAYALAAVLAPVVFIVWGGK